MSEGIQSQRDHLEAMLHSETAAPPVSIDASQALLDSRLGFAVERTTGHVSVPVAEPIQPKVVDPPRPASGLLALLHQDTETDDLITRLRKRAKEATDAAMDSLDSSVNRYLDIAKSVADAQNRDASPPTPEEATARPMSARTQARPASARLVNALEFARAESEEAPPPKPGRMVKVSPERGQQATPLKPSSPISSVSSPSIKLPTRASKAPKMASSNPGLFAWDRLSAADPKLGVSVGASSKPPTMSVSDARALVDSAEAELASMQTSSRSARNTGLFQLPGQRAAGRAKKDVVLSTFRRPGSKLN